MCEKEIVTQVSLATVVACGPALRSTAASPTRPKWVMRSCSVPPHRNTSNVQTPPNPYAN